MYTSKEFNEEINKDIALSKALASILTRVMSYNELLELADGLALKIDQLRAGKTRFVGDKETLIRFYEDKMKELRRKISKRTIYP